MVATLGQGSTVSTSAAPASMIAVAVAILNVEPGGNRPCSATGESPAALFCATARMSPVDGCSATSIVGRCWVSTAVCAACCTGLLTVDVRALAGVPVSTAMSLPLPSVSATYHDAGAACLPM